MHRSWRTVLPLVLLAALVGYLYSHRRPAIAPPPPATTSSETLATSAPPGRRLLGTLPTEARETLTLIATDGPFPYRQDGEVFGNYEHLLPDEPRGYYHEYTVTTPGTHNRGARRIVTGGNPPVTYYYTDDHYRSFRAFTVPR